jgi:hypothetical protein
VTNDELDAIEARANAATEGPWEHRPVKERDGTLVLTYPEIIFLPNNTVVARTYAWGNREAPRSAADKWQEAAGTAEFIAAARTDVPALVAEVRRLQEAMTLASADLRHLYRNVFLAGAKGWDLELVARAIRRLEKAKDAP